MIEIPGLLRHPLSDDARAVLEALVERRRDGEASPPAVATLAEQMGTLAPAVRAAAEELHERRLAVVAEAGTLAPVRWPRMASLAGRLRMNLADQLAAAGAAVDEGLAEAWAAADDEGRPPEDAEPAGEGPARHVWQAMMAAHFGRPDEALEHCRHAAAGTITVAVVPMLGRLAGWLDRLMLALGMPVARFFRGLPPESGDEQARQLYRQGWQAELVRNRQRAVRAYVAALRRDPGFDRARLRYAAVLFMAGEAQRALDEVTELVRARPRLAAARLMRAEVLVRMAEEGETRPPEHWAETVRDDVEAARRDPAGDQAWADVLLSRALLAKGMADEAAAAARRAVALEPGMAEAYHALGRALAAAGEFSSAAWAEASALLANHELTAAAEALYTLRQAPQVMAEVPHARLLIEDAWQ